MKITEDNLTAIDPGQVCIAVNKESGAPVEVKRLMGGYFLNVAHNGVYRDEEMSRWFSRIDAIEPDEPEKNGEEILAEFLGLYQTTHGDWYDPDDLIPYIDDTGGVLQFSSDWNWFMAVFSKIEQYEMDDDADDGMGSPGQLRREMYCEVMNANLEYAFDYAVKFVKAIQ